MHSSLSHNILGKSPRILFWSDFHSHNYSFLPLLPFLLLFLVLLCFIFAFAMLLIASHFSFICWNQMTDFIFPLMLYATISCCALYPVSVIRSFCIRANLKADLQVWMNSCTMTQHLLKEYPYIAIFIYKFFLQNLQVIWERTIWETGA